MGSLADVIATAAQPGLQLRTGRVVYLDTSRISVQVAGGDAVDMASPRGHQIVLGDYVQVLGQGGVWWCLGTPDGIPDGNALINPSFELDPWGTTPPTSWGIYNDPAGTAVAITGVAGAQAYPAHGTNVLAVTNTTSNTSITYVYSEAVPVQPGQVWAAAAAINPDITGPIGASSVQLSLSFHAGSGTAYPTIVGSLAVTDTWTLPAGGWPTWALLRQHLNASGTVVPDNPTITYMRVNLYTKIVGLGAVNWDSVILRRLDGN